MIIQEERESVVSEFQETYGEVDEGLESLGQQCFALGCAFMFQRVVESFQAKSYQTLALLKDELLAYHSQNGEGNGYIN